MKTRSLTCIVLFLLSTALYAAEPCLCGKVTDARTGEPICGAVIKVDDGAIWDASDLDGSYSLSLRPGNYSVTATCLGFVNVTVDVVVGRDGTVVVKNSEGRIVRPDFALSVESLALEEVVVTAQRSSGTLGTSHTLGKEAMEHLQMSNVTDINALLPGGKTTNPDLTKDTQFSLRDGGVKEGNASFGTAVEVDGVRLGTNAGLSEPSGVSTRSIPVENIESIEVITGVPSAEYGDLNSGMVKINTKKGRTPFDIMFSVNPRTIQTSLSKGVGLGDNKGVLNLSGEFARSTTKLTSPYTSYLRTNASALYSNTFNKVFRFEAGLSASIGGMNSKDDPDANEGNFQRVRDNNIRFNTSLTWMLNKSWITSLKAEFSTNFTDNLDRNHEFNSSASSLPAIHSTEKGYHIATALPLEYYSDKIIDSKELDFSAAIKYDWTGTFGIVKNHVKVGVQCKSNGNVGQGEYYENPALAANGYRPRPYSQYPFMNNLSEYIEDQVTLPIGRTKLDLSAGLRFEQLFVEGTKYKNMSTVSPRFNAKWELGKYFTVRGGWGVSEKLPSFYVLYPEQKYRDIRTFSVSSGSNASYVYYTIPFQMEYNPNLLWQRNNNSELGFDFSKKGWKVSLVGFYNVTKNPYQYQSVYTPLSYNIMQVPSDYTVPANPEIKVDSQTGMVYMRGGAQDYWTQMEVKTVDSTFVRSNIQSNGAPIYRAGVEMTLDFPEIRPIRTSFRLDASYSHSSYVDETPLAYYNTGWSHTSLTDRSYQYVGIYAGSDGSTTSNGRVSHEVNANLTSITHIPEVRLIFTIRLETSIIRRSRNLSQYNGAEYAYNVSADSYVPTGGSIYDGNSYAAICPVSYYTLDGQVHPFTAAQALDPEYANLLIRTGNMYTYNQDGYNFYCSLNFSVTKEIGDHVTLSFFANNFTASRPAVTSLATGVSAVFTPAFYYGLTCKIKI